MPSRSITSFLTNDAGAVGLLNSSTGKSIEDYFAQTRTAILGGETSSITGGSKTISDYVRNVASGIATGLLSSAPDDVSNLLGINSTAAKKLGINNLINTPDEQEKLNLFSAEVKERGFIRQNRFEVRFPMPAGVRHTIDVRTLFLFCDHLTLPGMSFGTAPIRSYGEVREMPYERIYDSLDMTFFVDTNMEIMELFKNWFHVIQDPTTKYFGYYDDYTTDMTIKALTKSGTPVYNIRCLECYPKAITGINMDYATPDIVRLTISMQVKKWTSHNNPVKRRRMRLPDGTETVVSESALSPSELERELSNPLDFRNSNRTINDFINLVADPIEAFNSVPGDIIADASNEILNAALNIGSRNLNLDLVQDSLRREVVNKVVNFA